MKYVLLLTGVMEPEDLAKSPEVAATYQRIGKWFEDGYKTGKIVGGEQLKGPQTATTVRFPNGKPMLTDGPFVEAKEVIGGFAIIEVSDLDEALAMAKTWPGNSTVEVRPVEDTMRP